MRLNSGTLSIHQRTAFSIILRKKDDLAGYPKIEMPFTGISLLITCVTPEYE